MVKLLINKGVDLTSAPVKVPHLPGHDECHVKYRQTPYIIYAACHGNLEIVRHLEKAGCDINDVGHICLSKRRQNSVAGNIICAAAFHGNKEVLEYCLGRINQSAVDLKVMETADRNAAKSGPFKTEYNDFTVLQLALVTPNQSVGTVKALFGRDVNQSVTENSTGNNILHLAAKYSTNIEVLEYVVKNARLDIFARNNEGDTALTLCQSVGNADGVAIIN